MPDSYLPKDSYYQETKIYQNHTSDNEQENYQVSERQKTLDVNQIEQKIEVVEKKKFQDIYDGRRC